VSVRTIQRLENGQKASLESLKCLAAVFETSVTTLVQEQSMTVIETPNQSIPQQKEKAAIAFVKTLRAFHMNWMTFIVIMPLLIVLNLVLIPGFLLAAIVGFCWGFGIALNALVVFRLFSLFSGEWEQNEFQRRLGMSDFDN